MQNKYLIVIGKLLGCNIGSYKLMYPKYVTFYSLNNCIYNGLKK